MNICQHFCGVICAAFSGNGIEHTQKLAAHSDDRLLFLKRIGFSGGIVVMQLSKLRIASYQRERREKQDSPEPCPATLADSGLSLVFPGTVFCNGKPGQLLYLTRRVKASYIADFGKDASYSD